MPMYQIPSLGQFWFGIPIPEMGMPSRTGDWSGWAVPVPYTRVRVAAGCFRVHYNDVWGLTAPVTTPRRDCVGRGLAPSTTNFFFLIQLIKTHFSCEIEDFVEIYPFKLCDTALRSRLLRGVSSSRI